jgi:hypothetical protein
MIEPSPGNSNFGFLLQEILVCAVDVHGLSRVGADNPVDVGRGEHGKIREPILDIQMLTVLEIKICKTQICLTFATAMTSS